MPLCLLVTSCEENILFQSWRNGDRMEFGGVKRGVSHLAENLHGSPKLTFLSVIPHEEA